MRAVVFDQSLRFDPSRLPPEAGEGECLVKVHLAGICATDLHITAGYMNFTGILGHEMVGTVVEGSEAWVGKRVVCEINCVCRECPMCQAGLSNHCRNRTVIGIDGHNGFFADLAAVPEVNLHEVPDVVSDEEAVFVEPLAAAYQVLAQCPIDARTTVTVVGAGRLGLLVAQVVKDRSDSLGGQSSKSSSPAGKQASPASKPASRVIVVGRNEKKLLLCEKKGIQGVHVDDVIAKRDRDVVVDCTGSPEGLELAMQLVRPRGTIVLKSTYGERGAPNLASIVVDEVTLLGSRCGPFPEAIDALARQAVEVRSMISRTYPIEQAVEAFEAARDRNNVKILLKINPR